MKQMAKNTIDCERDRYASYLDKAGLKLTKGRHLVFKEVMRAHGHFAAEELAKQCKNHKRNVSRATVYRSLTELLEAGIVRKTAFGEKHQHFEHTYDEKPHHHARCIKCGIYIEMPDLDEDNIYHPILKSKGFTILGHELHFYGICQKCQNIDVRVQ